MYRAISETMRDPFAINTIAMLKQLNIRVSKSSVREVFYQRFKDSHVLLLDDFQEILKGMGIATFLAKVDYSKLKRFTPPFLMELINDQGEDYFTLITKVDGNILYVYNINENTIVLQNISGDFAYKKCMVLLVESYNSGFEEENFQKNLVNERRKESFFSKSIRINHDLLTIQECGDIINYCEDNCMFERSLVSKLDLKNRLWTGYSHVRTSFSANLENYPSLYDIIKKIENSLQIEPGQIAPVHCVRYLPNQEFKIHHDAADGDTRMRSIFVYLNNCISGGETYFPEIKKRYTPKVGTCLAFPNLDKNLKRIPQSLHASLPVVDGVKYILTAYENI